MYNGGLGSAGKFAAINFDGSAVFSQGNISLAADGSQKWGEYATGNGVYVTGPGGSMTIRNENAFARALTVYRGGTSSDPLPGNLQAYISANGVIANLSGTVSTIASERRLKENIVSIDADVAWETIKTVPYYSYNFKSVSDVACYGPMADEVPGEMKVATDRTDDVGVIHTFDNGMLQARLYTALQTALTRIEALEAEVTALKAN